LIGKTAVVTGGAGGIGLATASRLLSEGAAVAIVDINQKALDEALKSLKQAILKSEKLNGGSGPRPAAIAIKADISSEASVIEMVQTLLKWTKTDLRTSVLNAGVSHRLKPITETDADEFDRVMSVNCRGAFLCLKHIGKAMQNFAEKDLDTPGSRSIILTSSVAGMHGQPGLVPYNASKWAVRGLMLTGAQELGQYGIRVNTVHPGGTHTNMLLGSFTAKDLEGIAKSVPLERFAQPEDIASCMAFLASDDANFVTGSMLKADGGFIQL